MPRADDGLRLAELRRESMGLTEKTLIDLTHGPNAEPGRRKPASTIKITPLVIISAPFATPNEKFTKPQPELCLGDETINKKITKPQPLQKSRKKLKSKTKNPEQKFIQNWLNPEKPLVLYVDSQTFLAFW